MTPSDWRRDFDLGAVWSGLFCDVCERRNPVAGVTVYGNDGSGFTIRIASVEKESWLHVCHRLHPGAWHWRNHRDLWRGLQSAASTSAYDKPNQIVQLWEANDRGQRMHFTDPNFEDIRSQSHSLQGLAEFGTGVESVSGGAEPTRTAVASVSQDFFPLMRVQPVLGRSFLPEDHRFGAAPVALVSYGYWRQRLGSATGLSAIKLTILNQAVSVIGVQPAGFRFPDGSEIWVPRELFERLPSRSAHNWQVIGRLRDGIGPDQAHAELVVIAR
jgi:hypothetical protein